MSWVGRPNPQDRIKNHSSLTMQEAKHGIFRDCLGFKDLKNFDGVRFACKGVQIVAFKFKEAINVDELIPIQHFNYKRKIKRSMYANDGTLVGL